MTATTTGEFRESLTSLDVEWTRTRADEFPSTLQSILREPAVGASLPIKDVSLSDGSIESTDGIGIGAKIAVMSGRIRPPPVKILQPPAGVGITPN